MALFSSKRREPPSLPPELWAMAMAYLDQPSKKRFRLSCKEFCTIATSSIFDTVYFDLDTDGLDNLLVIAAHNELRNHVRALVLRRRQALIPVSFDTWQDALAYAEKELEDNIVQIGDELTRHYADKDIPLAAYLSVCTETHRRQYNDYMADHDALAQRTQHLANCIRFHVPGRPDTRPLVQGNDHHQHHPAPSADLDRLDRFDDAISRFSNLRSFTHRPLFTATRRHRYRWRYYRLAFGPIVETAHPDLPAAEQDAEALHLSLSLRALGLAAHTRAVDLRHLAFATGSGAFGGAVGLGRLWDWRRVPYGRANGATVVLTGSEAVDAELRGWEERPGGRAKALERAERFGRELGTMEWAFVGLGRVDVDVEAGGAEKGMGLFRMLQRARGLECVRLRLGLGGHALRDSRLARDVLGMVAEARCWPKVRRVELVGVTVGRECLLGFLRTLAGSLRELVLRNCRLRDFACLEPEIQCWEDVFKGLAEDLRLDTVELCDLSDKPLGYTGERFVLRPSAEAWLQLGECYRYYESAIYDYLLGRSEWLPAVVPEDFLGNHAHSCEQARADIMRFLV